MNKKAITPIVATSLLIVVTVLAVISFQSWFSNFNSEMIVVVENQNIMNNINIVNLIGTNLYLKNFGERNITINSIKIGNKTCEIIPQNISPGLQKVDINNCIENISGIVKEVVVISNKNVYSKSLYFREENLDFSQKLNPINNLNDDFNLGNLDNIQIDNGNLILGENNSQYYLNGTYTSKIYDAGDLAKWNNLSIEYDLSNKFISSQVKNNLIAYYSFNENANDELGNFDGTVLDATKIENGKLGNAYSFDGSNDYISTGLNLNTELNFSIAVWIKLNSPSGLYFNILGHAVSGGNEILALRYYGDSAEPIDLRNKFIFGIRPTGGSFFQLGTLNSYTDINEWNLVSTSYDATSKETKIYVNGQLSNSDLYADSTFSNSYDEYFGAGNNNGNPVEFFNGVIDELGIWNRVLTDEEVIELYNSGNGLNFLEPTNLTLQIRTSNDNLTWTEWTNKSLSSTDISDSARYFQFRILFETNEISSTPVLKKISFNYELD